MEVEIKDKEKRVNIWLTHAESEDAALKESLQPLYQKYKKKKYLIAVFESGMDCLEELTRDLILYNRTRLRELEAKKAASG